MFLRANPMKTHNATRDQSVRNAKARNKTKSMSKAKNNFKPIEIRMGLMLDSLPEKIYKMANYKSALSYEKGKQTIEEIHGKFQTDLSSRPNVEMIEIDVDLFRIDNLVVHLTKSDSIPFVIEESLDKFTNHDILDLVTCAVFQNLERVLANDLVERSLLLKKMKKTPFILKSVSLGLTTGIKAGKLGLVINCQVE